MEKFAKGKAWKFGHDLEKDSHIFPFQYSKQASSGVPLEKLLDHLMEPLNPEFGKKVKKGDFLVAGRNFGHGKTHPHGARGLKMVGISAVIADSINRSFVKDALYFGLPMLTKEDI